MEKKTRKRHKRTAAERLLHEARQKPSPTVNDPRQLNAIQQQAFHDLDQVIARKLDEDEA
jgi:hypothetical protein